LVIAGVGFTVTTIE
jgi:hypothetical protein